MVVKEIMTADPASVDVTDNVADVFEVLHDLDVRHVPVTDNGELVGLISDRDLRSYQLPTVVEYNNPEKANARLKASASSVMHGDVVSVGTETSLSEVVRMMLDHKYGAVPVVDEIDGRLVGIVSYIDVLRAAEDYFESIS